MIRRSRRSLAAGLVAIVGLALCALVATSAIQLLLNKPPVLDYQRAANWAHSTQWTSIAVVIGGAVLAFAGLVLLLAAIVPGKALVLPLQGSGNTALTSGVRRRSTAAVLRSAAESVEGVDALKLKVRRRKVAAKVAANRFGAENLQAQVESALSEQLDRIDPRRRPRVRVKVSGVATGGGES
jgi:hypothetical protein